jgi:hypothetical protein
MARRAGHTNPCDQYFFYTSNKNIFQLKQFIKRIGRDFMIVGQAGKKGKRAIKARSAPLGKAQAGSACISL